LNIDGASPVERAYGRTNFAGDTRDTMTLKIPDVTPGTYVFVVTTTDACENVGECRDTFEILCDISRQASLQQSPGQDTKDVTHRRQDDLELYQNRPNPFRLSTVIGFNMPEAGEAKLIFYDIQGRTLKMMEGEYGKGYNEVEIYARDLQATGMLYYQIQTTTATLTKRMVITP
ncbi:MAG: T9SS type A sorting domain-containing protein, partial [Saprospiraceae bacterium]|nr:T9SS type A sorting domain-containing protein [Saprospiraceae bacterium]